MYRDQGKEARDFKNLFQIFALNAAARAPRSKGACCAWRIPFNHIYAVSQEQAVRRDYPGLCPERLFMLMTEQNQQIVRRHIADVINRDPRNRDPADLFEVERSRSGDRGGHGSRSGRMTSGRVADLLNAEPFELERETVVDRAALLLVLARFYAQGGERVGDQRGDRKMEVDAGRLVDEVE